MPKIRGTKQVAQVNDWKPYELIKSHVYSGPINRDYESQARFRIAYPGQPPYTISSSKDLQTLKKKHAKAEVTPL